MPWSGLFKAGWRIVGMNHFRLNGATYLFCAMTKDGKCIVSEGTNDEQVFVDLERKAILAV